MTRKKVRKKKIGFEVLPNELKKFLVDYLDTKSSLAISQCSKLFHTYVHESKFFIENIRVTNDSKKEALQIFVGHTNFNKPDYSLSFKKLETNEVEITRNRMSDDKMYFSEKVETSQTAFDFSLNYFKKLIIKYAANIRKLAVYRNPIDWDWAEVKVFKRLEVLIVSREAVAKILLQKTVVPLKQLGLTNLYVEPMTDGLANFEQIYQVKHLLNLERTIFTDDQLCQIRADWITIYLGPITPNGVLRFVRQWIAGERSTLNALHIFWNPEEQFDTDAVLRPFRDQFVEDCPQPHRIHQYNPNITDAYFEINRTENSVELMFKTIRD